MDILQKFYLSSNNKEEELTLFTLITILKLLKIRNKKLYIILKEKIENIINEKIDIKKFNF